MVGEPLIDVADDIPHLLRPLDDVPPLAPEVVEPTRAALRRGKGSMSAPGWFGD
jgi:hypothetical protein